MYTVKFEVLKRKAKDLLNMYEDRGMVFFSRPETFLAILPAIASGKKPRDLLKDWYEEAKKVVDQWDVRLCTKLIECFPEIVPLRYRHATPTVYIEDNKNADWMVSFDS